MDVDNNENNSGEGDIEQNTPRAESPPNVPFPGEMVEVNTSSADSMSEENVEAAGRENPDDNEAENALLEEIINHNEYAEPDADDASTSNEIHFDTNLPAEHSYLGNNMNRVGGVEYLEFGKSHRIMLFMHQNIVFPGEILPFIIPGFVIDPDIDSDNGLLFGVAFAHLRCRKRGAMYGVTCQIYEKGTDDRGNTLIKSRALQRFITTNGTKRDDLEYITSGPQVKSYGYVSVLPDIYLPDPLRTMNIGSMNRFRDINSLQAKLQDYRASFTAFPKHFYYQYDLDIIVKKILKNLEAHKVQSMPTDPLKLSFWLSRNSHLSEDQMKRIFIGNCVNTRIKIIAESFYDGGVFVCRFCGNQIALCRDLFAMSRNGIQSQYCNSAGYIHETNTVYKLLDDAITFNGEPSSEFSWFPGYEWHIVICKMCNRHIGWQFRASKPDLSPALFYGIAGASVRIEKENKRRFFRDSIFDGYFNTST